MKFSFEKKNQISTMDQWDLAPAEGFTESKKPKRKFEWTEKRKQAFQKCQERRAQEIEKKKSSPLETLPTIPEPCVVNDPLPKDSSPSSILVENLGPISTPSDVSGNHETVLENNNAKFETIDKSEKENYHWKFGYHVLKSLESSSDSESSSSNEEENFKKKVKKLVKKRKAKKKQQNEQHRKQELADMIQASLNPFEEKINYSLKKFQETALRSASSPLHTSNNTPNQKPSLNRDPPKKMMYHFL